MRIHCTAAYIWSFFDIIPSSLEEVHKNWCVYSSIIYIFFAGAASFVYKRPHFTCLTIRISHNLNTKHKNIHQQHTFINPFPVSNWLWEPPSQCAGQASGSAALARWAPEPHWICEPTACHIDTRSTYSAAQPPGGTASRGSQRDTTARTDRRKRGNPWAVTVCRMYNGDAVTQEGLILANTRISWI